MSTTTAAELFDPAFVRGLEGLRMLARSVPAGGRHAEQRSRARGAGQEFTDVRAYVAGDDFRTVDWHVFLRLDKVFVRLFLEDQDLPVYFVLDQSASMARQAAAPGAMSRSVVARRVVAALAYVALNHMDRVAVFPFASEPLRGLPGLSGKGAFQRLLAWLAALPATGGTGLCEALRSFGARRLRRGLCVVVTDGFDARGADAVLAELRRLPHRPLIVRPVHAGEDRPEHLRGEIRAVDCESGQHLELSVDDALLDRYRAAYRKFEEELAAFAQSRGGGYLAVRTDQPLLPQLAQVFQHGVLTV
ncbi:MAG: DUF58 domain-containing protein [Planctomycetes bacterium]|nr:DUF58 domain-containing protein [Planctomycetota bacterium]MCB9886441.1 DUF58 domain-containing protein [Planctomycetota bacterium]